MRAQVRANTSDLLNIQAAAVLLRRSKLWPFLAFLGWVAYARAGVLLYPEGGGFGVSPPLAVGAL